MLVVEHWGGAKVDRPFLRSCHPHTCAVSPPSRPPLDRAASRVAGSACLFSCLLHGLPLGTVYIGSLDCGESRLGSLDFGRATGDDWVSNSTEQQQQEPTTACLEQHMIFFNYGGYEGNTSVSANMTPPSAFITFHDVDEKISAAFCIFLTHPIAWDFYYIFLGVENFFLHVSGSFLSSAPAGGLVGGLSRGSAGPRFVALGGVMGATRDLLALVVFLRGDNVFAFEKSIEGSDVGVEQSIEHMSSSPILEDVEGSQMLLAGGEEWGGSFPTPELSATEIGGAARTQRGSGKAQLSEKQTDMPVVSSRLSEKQTEMRVVSAPLSEKQTDAQER